MNNGKMGCRVLRDVSLTRMLLAAAAGVFLLALTGCLKSSPVPRQAGSPCSGLAGYGFPSIRIDQKETFFVCHLGYALDFNEGTRTPIWVVEHLTRDDLDQRLAERLENFRPDPDLPQLVSSELGDYARSGYDRGHMAPAEDFRKSTDEMNESFFLSNMVPQNPENNLGIWAQLEKQVRYWAVKQGGLYVVTGPIYAGNQSVTWIGHGRVAVPTHLFKVVLSPSRKAAVGFIIPNVPIPPQASLAAFEVPVTEVERVTGITFFPEVEPGQAWAIKSSLPRDW